MKRLFALVAIPILFGIPPLRAQTAAEIKKIQWTGRLLAFDSKDDTTQPPLIAPEILSGHVHSVSASNTYKRKGRIVGLIDKDFETYLVVDMLDTHERYYFFYGGTSAANGPTSPPLGTHFVQSTRKATSKKKKPSVSAPAAGGTGDASFSSNSSGILGPLLSLGLIGGLIFVLAKAQSPAGAPETRTTTPGNDEGLKSLGLRATVSTGPPIPRFQAADSNGDRFWKRAGQSASISGFEIGGMVYVGSGLASVGAGGAEPSLIDPRLRVASDIDECSTRRMTYWPRYNGISSEARASYLKWLATGRKDPSADIGYVFLFFYGLERRALHDAKSSEQAKSEIPDIEKEVDRLLSIYDNRSFQGYAGNFLDILRAKNASAKLYEKPPPALPGRYLRFTHRLALAQCAADGRPLPAEWAYAWLQGDATTRLKTPAHRCPQHFKQLFIRRYGQEFGDGLELPRNKTQLRLDYHPASAGFGAYGARLGVSFGLPDVTTLSAPLRALHDVAERCCSELEPYSRSVGKGSVQADTFPTVVQLPPELWPVPHRASLDRAQAIAKQRDGFATLKFNEFKSWFPDWKEVRRDDFEAVCRGLESVGVGIEPDPRFGGSLPEETSTIILFISGARRGDALSSPRLNASSLTIHLAAAVAWADGSVHETEQKFILGQLNDWLDLSPTDRSRLNAVARRMLEEPPKLTGLKARIAELGKPARESLGQFVALVAQADNHVSPAEVKTVEKIFKLLGLDSKTVYSSLHAAASEPVTIRPPHPTTGEFRIPTPPSEGGKGRQIDPAKVAALKADSERVSAMLGKIFADEPSSPEAPAPASKEPEPPKDGLLGLDTEHSAFLRVLASRSQWTRAELEEISRDRGLMLDGALERVNDAAFAKFDNPIFEGEDPIELNPVVLKELLNDSYQAA